MKRALLALMTAAVVNAQVLPEGTTVTLRLEEAISSATAEKGQPIEFTVMEDVLSGDTVVLKQGARALGAITEAEPKKRMGRSGKVDFTVEKVRAVDGRYVTLRPTKSNYKGHGNGLKVGLIAAGVSAVCWACAPAALLIKGKDVSIPKGTRFNVFTDNSYTLSATTADRPPVAARIEERPQRQAIESPTLSTSTASVTINSSSAGAEISVDGVFMGSTPTTMNLNAGRHKIVVSDAQSTYEREIVVTAGGKININAQLIPIALAAKH
ncbi:MAG: PEGA domain-containing protein [Acidobacteria bacterium]|nr:PEGA domain-containing protein [Acidobacteriota bacterium]